GRVEGADAGPGGADAFGQVALRHEFELDLTRPIQTIEYPGVALPREGADDLAHRPRLKQRREPRVAVTRVVVDHRQTLQPAGDERVDEFARLPGAAEAADHDDGTVGDVGDRALDVGDRLVDHVRRPSVRCANDCSSSDYSSEPRDARRGPAAAVPRWAHGQLLVGGIGARR